MSLLKQNKFENFDSTQDALNFLLSMQTDSETTNSIHILNFNFIINNKIDEFQPKDLKKLRRKFMKKTVLIVLATNIYSKFQIYWKTKELKQLLTLKPICDKNSKNFCNFIADFLYTSLINGFLGIANERSTLQHKPAIGIDDLIDTRNFNLLLLACESGNESVIEILLDYGINPESNDKTVKAQNLAWNNGHMEVVLKLLHRNLPFPELITKETSNVELKNFILSSEKFHESIKSENEDELRKLHSHFSKLRYFYNISNESALKVALTHKKIQIYEFLVARGFSLAPHEDIDSIWKDLTLTDKEDLHEIHIKYLKDIPQKHINILMANTSFSHDEINGDQKRQLVLYAYQTLSRDPYLKVILKVVAAFKKFHVVFDFQRDSTHMIDPTTTSHTTGIFYFTGRIVIGAKSLLDPQKEHETFGTLAHELCHCAMFVTFENKTNPYANHDKEAIEQFEEISEICRQKMNHEDIITFVYKHYSKNQQHSELIVRPPHMIAYYLTKPEIFLKKREIFTELFEYFEKTIVPAMEAALPEIEGRLEYKPCYNFKNLSEQNKLKVQNANVKYKNLRITLSELFCGRNIPYEKLTSEHIAQILGGKILVLNDPHLHYINDLIEFNWRNICEKLRQKLLNSVLVFQNTNVKFRSLLKVVPEAFNALTSEQIIKVLCGEKLFIGEDFQMESDFYVERNFIPEDAKGISFEYEYGHDYVHDRFIENEHKIKRFNMLKKSFDVFLSEFLEQSFDVRSKILDKIKQNNLYKIRYYDLSCGYFKFMHGTLNDIIEKTEIERIFILSSEAGAGKTTCFERLRMAVKKKYQSRWVSYIDLKDFTRYYKIDAEEIFEFFGGISLENFEISDINSEKEGLGFKKAQRKVLEINNQIGSINIALENIENLLQKILKLDPKNKFEIKAFQESFYSGNLVLILNGFDEISPTYNQFVLNLINSIYNLTTNFQFVCTRPLYSNQLSELFSARSWQLVPFNDEEKAQFLREFFEFQNVEEVNITENIEKVIEITRKFVFDHKNFRDFNTPLMLRLVAETYEDNRLFETKNIYGIYETFVRKKIRIWLKQSEFAKKTTENLILRSSRIGIAEIYQKYAIFNLSKICSGTTLNLKIRKLQILNKKIPKNLTNEEITRMGILYINNENEYEFAHKTFCEFFVAQYVIENIFMANDGVAVEEMELRLEYFFKIIKDSIYLKIVMDFMYDFLKLDCDEVDEPFSDTLRDLLRTKFRRFIMYMVNMNNPENFEFLFEFFKRDHELLVELMHVDQDQTFFTSIFDPNNFSITTHAEKLKALAANYLQDEEFQKFIHGKHQKGVILFGRYFYGKTKIFDAYEKDFLKLKCSNVWEFFEEVRECLTGDEQKAIFMTALSPKIFLFYNKIFDFSGDFNDSWFTELFGDVKNKPQINKPSSSFQLESSLSYTDKIKNFISTYTKTPTRSENTKKVHQSKKNFEKSTLNNATLEKSSSFFQYMKLWSLYEDLLSKKEMQTSLTKALNDYFEIYGAKKSGGDFFLKFFVFKCEQYLSDNEIFEMFITHNILHEAFRGNFEIVWKFICRHTDHEQQKQLLQQNDANNDKKLYFYFYPDGEVKKDLSNYTFYYFYYDFTPFNILQRFMTVPSASDLEFVIQIYEKYFTKKEIQGIITSSNDILYYITGRVLEVPCRKFVAFLENIFDGEQELLREFLGRKVKPINQPIFQYLQFFKHSNDPVVFKNVEIFFELYNKLEKNNF